MADKLKVTWGRERRERFKEKERAVSGREDELLLSLRVLFFLRGRRVEEWLEEVRL